MRVNESNLKRRNKQSRLRIYTAFLRHLPLLSLLTLFTLSAVSCQDRSSSRHTPDGHRVDHRKPLAWGHEQTIYVFADDSVWRYAEKPLRESIERFYFTTENETYFDLKRADFESLQHFYRFKNLLFLGHIDSQRDVSAYLKQHLAANVLESVEQNGAGMFVRQNLWANDQLVVFLLGNAEETLLRYNLIQADDLFESFRKKLYERTESQVYGIEIHPESMFRNLVWTMKLPESYVPYKRSDSGDFVSYIARRRDNPDRYISVYSESMKEDNVDINWLIETRKRLVWEFYDEDEFSREDSRSQRIDFQGRNSLKLAGRWQNRKYAIGGAFRSFAFYDEESKRAFLIDNTVFYPQGFKLPALIELEVISRTLQIKRPVNQADLSVRL